MSTFVNDLRYGLRQLGKNPGFTLVMVLVLSLGISVSVTLFGIVDWRLRPPSPFSDPKRIVHVSVSSETAREDDLSYLDFLALREQLPSLSGLAAVSLREANLKKNGWSWRCETGEVSRDFFSVAGVRAQLGNVFSEGDSRELRNQAGVVLSHRLWASQFGSDPTIVGRAILLDEVSRVVLGVAPPWFQPLCSFEQGDVIDIWMPVDPGGDPAGRRLERLVGRLQPTASLPALRGEMEVACQRLKLRNPRTLAPLKPLVLSDEGYRYGGGYPAPALFLTGLGCVILLIACFNVSGSLLAKAETRRTEIAVRRALGGSRVQLARQFLTEGMLLAAPALVLGLVVSYWLMNLLRSLLSADTGRVFRLNYLNPRVAVFAFSVTLVGTLLFEFLPIRHTCRASLIPTLQADRSLSPRWGRGHGLSLLVVLQLAMALVLTVCAGALLRSYLKASSTEAGLRERNVLLARLQPGGNARQSQVFFQDLVAHVRTLSGVIDVGLGSWAPTDRFRYGRKYEVSVPGDNGPADNYSVSVEANIVDSGYFATTGIPILKGHSFPERIDPRDFRQVIINGTLASRLWPDRDPVGRFVQLTGPDRDRAAAEIAQVAGVVRDAGDGGARPAPGLYVPWGQAFSGTMTLLVETRGDPRLLAEPIRDIIQRLDVRVPVYPMTTLAQETQTSKGRAQDPKLIGSISLIGMALASLGLYGVVAFAVTRQTREMGIRMALGARSRDVLQAVMAEGVKLSLLGLGIGLIGSFLVSRILRAAMFGVGSFDFVTFAGSGAVLMGTALLACYIPARRAARIDPMVALRYE